MDSTDGFADPGGNQTCTDLDQFYKIAFEETDAAIIISDFHGRCIVANPSALALTGYSREELVGTDMLDLFQANDQAPSIQRDALPVGITLAAEGRLRRKNGGFPWVELRIRKLPDGNFLESLYDITERTLSDETLRKNEELFRIAFDHAPTGMSIIGPDGLTYLAVNPLLCEMFGFTKEEFLGQTIHLVTHPDDEARSNEWVQKKINDEPCEPYLEKRYIHKEGHIIWGLVSAHWIKNDDGSHRMAIAHVQDITDRKKAEEERKNLQAQLAAAMELAHLGHWEYDVENDTFTFNDHFYSIFGTSAEAECGYTMTSEQYAARFAHPDDRLSVKQEIRNAIGAPDPDFNRKIEHRFLYSDGRIGYISVHYFIVKNEQGQTVKIYGINQDITDRIHAEEERRKLEDQIRHAQKMESIGLLAGGVAHDFNNLLTPILGYAEILSHDLDEADERRMLLRYIREAAERAREVVRRLLAFSRKQVLELKTIDLGDIIRKFENMLRRTIRENIDIQFNIPADLFSVKADPGQIEQVLLNLSINAQDAMPGGGQLLIEADNVHLDSARLSASLDVEPGAYVMLSVKDNGAGMDEEVIKHIFEPFYTTKGPGRGTGLGLSTAYGIVKQHGGSIKVNSVMGRGSIFKIFLPQVAIKQGGKNAEDLNPDAIVRGHETILVAEDSEMVRSLACNMLTQLGYTVLAAEDPERCIDLVKQHDGIIHLLLTDLIMPGMNGKELYNTLNKLQTDLKVVFMSGYASRS